MDFYFLERNYNLLINIHTKLQEGKIISLCPWLLLNMSIVQNSHWESWWLVVPGCPSLSVSSWPQTCRSLQPCEFLFWPWLSYSYPVVNNNVLMLIMRFDTKQTTKLTIERQPFCRRHARLLTCRSFRVWIFCAITNIFFSRSILWERILYWCFLILASFYSHEQDTGKCKHFITINSFRNWFHCMNWDYISRQW